MCKIKIFSMVHNLINRANHSQKQKVWFAHFNRHFYTFNCTDKVCIESKLCDVSWSLNWHKNSMTLATSLRIKCKILHVKYMQCEKLHILGVIEVSRLGVEGTFIYHIIKLYVYLFIYWLNICCHFLVQKIKDSVWCAQEYTVAFIGYFKSHHEDGI